MEPKQNKDDRPEEYEETHEGDEGASVIEKDQPSFVDEKSPRGKQFGDGRKVADLGRVGAVTPDADSDELPRQPRK
jgi:hypothetical protein